jgi:hypothetical protein
VSGTIRTSVRMADERDYELSAVKYQMNLHGKTLKEGDVLVANSPHAGGSCVVSPSPSPTPHVLSGTCPTSP